MAERKTDFLDVDSLAEMRRRFQKPGWALRLFEWLRWPDGRFCPACGGFDHLPIKGRQKTGVYHCRDCRHQFSATSGTPLHKTKLPLETWMEAAFLIASSSKGVSSVVLAQQLGVQQKTAWKIAHAIRRMMTPADDAPPLTGVVEVDDMALGEDPQRTNRRKYGTEMGKLIHNPRGRGSSKPRYLIAVERGGRARVKPMNDGDSQTIASLLDQTTSREATLMTDGDKALRAVGKGYAAHHAVVHSSGEYARGDAHVNSAEAFHLYTQRAKFGVWHRWSENHQQRYLDELAFHWEHRPKFETLNGKRHRIARSTPVILRMQQIFRNAGGRRLTRVGASVSDTGHKM